MTELQINTRHNISGYFEQLASEKAQIQYKNTVPFVHIPDELNAQWNGLFRPKNRTWFKEIWTNDEYDFLSYFNTEFEKIMKKTKWDFADVPEVFNDENWRILMKLASKGKVSIPRIFKDS